MVLPFRPALILASASPRRCDLLRHAGYEVQVVPPRLAEPTHRPADASPAAYAEALSHFKAASVAGHIHVGIILGGDTIVSLENLVYGKPVDRDDARRILRALGGSTHMVITGVTLLDAATGRRMIAHDSTAVTMKPLTGEQLDEYLDSGEWAGKAGAYGIQDRGDAFIERIEGSFTNVVGLPMELLERMLAAWQADE